jgi:pimeloyl-ACP methyl ester carboxylesterase
LKERTVSVRGGMFQADVREYGSDAAEPLLFLHGSSGLLDGSYLDSLGERYHVVAPLHPGFGASTGLDAVDDIVDLAIYYYDLLDELGIESANVVGHSLGGMLAAEVAALDPHRVRRLVLANAIGLWRDDAPVLDYFSTDMRALQAAVWTDPESELVKSRQPDMSDMEAFAATMYESLQSLSAAAKFVWPIPDKGLKKRLHRIAAPTLILWGEDDGLVPPVYAEEFRSRIHGARVAILRRCAHMPMLEQPDEWVSAVVEFLADGS